MLPLLTRLGLMLSIVCYFSFLPVLFAQGEAKPNAAARNILKAINEREGDSRKDTLFFIGYASAMQDDLDMGFDEESIEAITAGFRAALEGAGEPSEIPVLSKKAQALLSAQKERHMAGMRAENLREATSFLAKLDQDETVERSESGLRFQIEKKGLAAEFTEPSVTINYQVKGLEGRMVIDGGDGVTVELREAFLGLEESIRMLGVGGVGTFYIPSNLAHGDDGSLDGTIEPGQLIVLELELVSLSVAEGETEN